MAKGDERLTPLEAVAREMSGTSDLTEPELRVALTAGLNVLMRRAEDELARDDASDEALDASKQFLAFAEMISMFGAALLRYDDENETPSKKKTQLSN